MESLKMESLQVEQKKTNEIRVHRVGSITAGMSLIVWGILFILHEVGLIANLEMILKLWPCILIGLGLEILCFNISTKKLDYDKGAVFLMILMAGFSVVMAIAETCFNYMASIA